MNNLTNSDIFASLGDIRASVMNRLLVCTAIEQLKMLNKCGLSGEVLDKAMNQVIQRVVDEAIKEVDEAIKEVRNGGHASSDNGFSSESMRLMHAKRLIEPSMRN